MIIVGWMAYHGLSLEAVKKSYLELVSGASSRVGIAGRGM